MDTNEINNVAREEKNEHNHLSPLAAHFLNAFERSRCFSG